MFADVARRRLHQSNCRLRLEQHELTRERRIQPLEGALADHDIVQSRGHFSLLPMLAVVDLTPVVLDFVGGLARGRPRPVQAELLVASAVVVGEQLLDRLQQPLQRRHQQPDSVLLNLLQRDGQLLNGLHGHAALPVLARQEQQLGNPRAPLLHLALQHTDRLLRDIAHALEPRPCALDVLAEEREDHRVCRAVPRSRNLGVPQMEWSAAHLRTPYKRVNPTHLEALLELLLGEFFLQACAHPDTPVPHTLACERGLRHVSHPDHCLSWTGRLAALCSASLYRASLMFELGSPVELCRTFKVQLCPHKKGEATGRSEGSGRSVPSLRWLRKLRQENRDEAGCCASARAPECGRLRVAARLPRCHGGQAHRGHNTAITANVHLARARAF